jgi:superfamily I DNA/RNA helicase
MSQNLITAGVIDPRQIPLDEVRQQVATFLKISLNQIERLECWKNQIWVKLVESRAKFISYRNLPLWLEQGFAAIKGCTTRSTLDQLGEILRSERDWYEQHDMPQAVQPWRDAWAQQAQHLREEEERTRPIRAHQQAGVEWYSAWQRVLRRCRDCTGLERLAPEINQQSQEFADLPEVVQAMQQQWQERWQELSEAIA